MASLSSRISGLLSPEKTAVPSTAVDETTLEATVRRESRSTQGQTTSGEANYEDERSLIDRSEEDLDSEDDEALTIKDLSDTDASELESEAELSPSQLHHLGPDHCRVIYNATLPGSKKENVVCGKLQGKCNRHLKKRLQGNCQRGQPGYYEGVSAKTEGLTHGRTAGPFLSVKEAEIRRLEEQQDVKDILQHQSERVSPDAGDELHAFREEKKHRSEGTQVQVQFGQETSSPTRYKATEKFSIMDPRKLEELATATNRRNGKRSAQQQTSDPQPSVKEQLQAQQIADLTAQVQLLVNQNQNTHSRKTKTTSKKGGAETDDESRGVRRRAQRKKDKRRLHRRRRREFDSDDDSSSSSSTSDSSVSRGSSDDSETDSDESFSSDSTSWDRNRQRRRRGTKKKKGKNHKKKRKGRSRRKQEPRPAPYSITKGKDISTGDKDKIFGMDVSGTTIDKVLAPTGMRAKEMDGVYDVTADITSLPGMFSSRGDMDQENRKVDDPTTSMMELLMAHTAGNSKKRHLQDPLWQKITKHGLGLVKDAETLEKLLVDVTDAEYSVFENQRFLLHAFLRPYHYSEDDIEAYCDKGFLPTLVTITYRNYVQLLGAIRNLQLNYNGHDWRNSPAKAMLDFHSDKLLAIRTGSRLKKFHLLRTYTYLRDARVHKFQDLSMNKSIWSKLAELESKLAMAQMAAAPSQEQLPPNKEPTTIISCPHCKNHVLHQRLGLAHTKIVCPLTVHNSWTAQKMARKILRSHTGNKSITTVVKDTLDTWGE